MSKVKIRVNQYGGGEFYLDGRDISSSVRGFTLSAGIRGNTTILEVGLTGDIEISGDAQIILRLPNGQRFGVKNAD